MIRLLCMLPLLVCLNAAAWAELAVTLPDTKPLEEDGDLSAKMLAGLHRFVERKTDESVKARLKLWQRDLSSADTYEKSVQPNRERFRKILGLVDKRLPVVMERFGDDDNPALVAETLRYRVYQVRWPVLYGLWGEGLLLEPRGKPAAHVVALPDADQTPEQIAGLAKGVTPESQYARRLAENGFQVLVPALVSQGIDFSGNSRIAMTTRPTTTSPPGWPSAASSSSRPTTSTAGKTSTGCSIARATRSNCRCSRSSPPSTTKSSTGWRRCPMWTTSGSPSMG